VVKAEERALRKGIRQNQKANAARRKLLASDLPGLGRRQRKGPRDRDRARRRRP
jgi:hypothetical protein